jgi:hypothetical protein
MSDNRRKRPWVAALLALLYPGLGHLYLRYWMRSMLWFGLTLVAVVVVVPAPSVVGDGPVAFATAAWETTAGLGLRVRLLLAGILFAEVIDAYVLARRTSGTSDERCPSCGRALEADLSFCPWCARDLDVASA